MKSPLQQLWDRCKPTLKLKKFWITLFSILSILGISIHPTLQDKLADLAVEIATLMLTTEQNNNSIINNNNYLEISHE